MRPSRSEYLDLPSVRLHIRRWGDPAAPTLFLLHGWMDVSASFQFVVDELQRDWNIIAPDWRGFGPSDWLGRPYFFAEHLGELVDGFGERPGGGRADLEAAGIDEAHQQRLAVEVAQSNRIAPRIEKLMPAHVPADGRLAVAQRRLRIELGRRAGLLRGQWSGQQDRGKCQRDPKTCHLDRPSAVAAASTRLSCTSDAKNAPIAVLRPGARASNQALCTKWPPPMAAPSR